MADPSQDQSKFSFIKKSLPWLGTIASIALPQAAPLVAIATKILGGKLNKSISPDTNSLSDALSAALGDPTQHTALVEAEQAYQQAMTQLGYQHETDMEAIAEKDRDSARQMQVQTKSWMPSMLALAAVATLMGCIYMLGFRSIPDTGHDALLILLGAVTVTYKDVYGYFFGSSAGSDRKTEILANGNGH